MTRNLYFVMRRIKGQMGKTKDVLILTQVKKRNLPNLRNKKKNKRL